MDNGFYGLKTKLDWDELFEELRSIKNIFVNDSRLLYDELLDECYKRKDLNYKINDSGLIMFIISSGKFSWYLLDNFLRNGGDANIRLKDNATPLILVCSWPVSDELAYILLNYGADVDLKDNNGKKASYYASEIKKSYRLSRELRSMEKENFQELDKSFAKNLELLEDYKKLVNLYLKNGDINITDKYKNTLLMYSSMFADLTILKLCLECEIDVNSQNYKGQTALMFAVLYNNIEAIKLILEHKSDLFLRDYQGKTVFYYARESKNTHITELFELLESKDEVDKPEEKLYLKNIRRNYE